MAGSDLKDKSILVTGASSGIGMQISLDSIMQGAEIVVGIARRADNLNDVKSRCQVPEKFIPRVFDLGDFDKMKELVASLPILDGVVLNAGIADFVPVRFINSDKIDKIFEINFKSTVLLMTELLKQKKIKNNCSIVIISSISSQLGVPGTAVYAASKGALSSYGRVLASELASSKARVNSVLPGLVVTDLIGDQSSLNDEILKKNALTYPLGLGKPSDVSSLVTYLLSDGSRWMTGSEIIIDGGHLLT